ncbi:MAG: ComEC/Rec2 family competence protein, partial [Verrucomicrobiota bacterium]|nr:ComEC/Rec2 family competence protein [Verrucomicrobiota bacterium]
MKSSATWPRQPFIGLALAACVGILLADKFAYLPAGLGGLLLFGAIALLRRSSLATYLFAASSFFCLHALRVIDSPGLRLARELDNRPQAVTVAGFVVSEPKISAHGSASFLLRAFSLEHDGLTSPCFATVSARWPGPVRYGDEIRVFGAVSPIPGPRNPGEFDMRRYLARHDVRTAFVSRYAENGRVLRHGGGNPVLRAAHLSRARMDVALGRGLEDSLDQHSLISGIVLGLREQTPDEIEEQFQQTGTIHLFATAGLHVGIVAYLLWIMAAVLRLPRKVAICLIVPGLFFYAAITGWNTASVRAATMAAVVLGGAFLDRRVQPANSLAAAAVFLLCVDTQQLFSMGFQLSFAVVGTIILIANPIFNFFFGWFQPDPFLPKSLYSHARKIGLTSGRMIARGASISLAAWLGSLLLILPYFYLITPISLFANLAVVPVAFFVLAFGLLALLTATIAPWLSLVFNNANWFLATIILRTVAFFAHAPAGHIYLELPHRPTGARVAITALDLGAGAAIHLRNGNTDYLIDCGANRDFARVVRGYLRSRGINRLD